MNKKKTKIHKFGHDYYYLGQDCDGINHFLQEASWDCGWYWGGGYVESFTNNRNPIMSRDIRSHNHFDSMFFNSNVNGFDTFNAFFEVTPFTASEIWKICELMKSFYIAREYSDFINRGGAHYTSNPAAEVIRDPDEYDRINKIVIPAIIKELYSILSPEV